MAMKIIGNVILEPQATAPISPLEGEVFYNSTTETMQFYDGSGWVDM